MAKRARRLIERGKRWQAYAEQGAAHIYTAKQYHGCKRKRPHPDRGRALAVARERVARGEAPQLWVYQCRYCGKWHLTRQPQSDPRNAARVVD